jgi:hypothetical protein
MNPKNAGKPCPYKHYATNAFGQNTIGKYMQEIAKIAEFDVTEHGKISNQGGRSLFITRMVQEGVDQENNEAFARQNCGDNVNTGYQEIGPEGRFKKMKAVGPQEEKIKELRQLLALKKGANLNEIAKKEANVFDNLKKMTSKESKPKLKESKPKSVHVQTHKKQHRNMKKCSKKRYSFETAHPMQVMNPMMQMNQHHNQFGFIKGSRTILGC